MQIFNFHIGGIKIPYVTVVIIVFQNRAGICAIRINDNTVYAEPINFTD